MPSRDLLDWENFYRGPMPKDVRWALRFGSRARFERARLQASVRHVRREAARLVRALRPSPELHNQVRRLLATA